MAARNFLRIARAQPWTFMEFTRLPRYAVLKRIALWKLATETSGTVAAALIALATRCARAAPRSETRWTRVRFCARVLFLVMRH